MALANGWTVQIGAAGGALTTYPMGLPEFFVKRLNGVGHFSCLLAGVSGNSVPARDQLIRFVWRAGESDERTHFEGIITDVRRRDRSNVYRLRGLSLDGLLWMQATGDIRKWTTQTPYTIVQAAGSPNGLLYNSQGNLRPIGSTTLQYGTAAGVPNKVDGANPGTAFTFRADSSRSLANIQRLCLQARYDGSSYGLEFLTQLEGANNSDPRFYLVKRRNRSSGYAAETFTVPTTLLKAHRGHEGLTAANLVKVVGQGDGTARVISSSIGTGALEGIVADKTVIDATAATNMANRLGDLLNPATEVITGWTLKHNFSTEIGDDVTVSQSGEANTTLRCFELGYDRRAHGFFMVLGRPRALQEDALLKLDALSGGQAHGPQKTDFVVPASTSLGEIATTTLTTDNTTRAEATVNLTDQAVADIEHLFIRAQYTGTGGADWLVEVAVSDNDVFASGSRILVAREWIASLDINGTGMPASDEVLEKVYVVPVALLQGITTIRSARIRVGTTSAASENLDVYASFDVVDNHRHNE